MIEGGGLLETVEQENEFNLDRSASHLLHRAQQFAAEKFESMGEVGITLRQFAVLAAVYEQEGCTQSELVKSTGIDRSTLADMVARMERNGFIERRQAKLDARAKAVHLTDQGREALDAAKPMVQRSDEAILSMLPKNRRRAFLGVLGLLANVGDIGFEELDSPVDVKAKKKSNDTKSEDKKKKDKKEKKKAKKKKDKD